MITKRALSPNQIATLNRYRAAIEARLQRGDVVLPVLPEIASEVLAMSQDPDLNAQKLSSLIHRDQALAANVLQVANSGIYMAGRPAVSLIQAVIRLGSTAISEIAFGLALGGKVFEAPGYEEEVQALWQHAAASGTYGREMAAMLRANAEGQFLMGLLHTAGQAAVLQTIVHVQRGSGWPPLPGLYAFQLMQEYEVEAGVLVFEQWELPAAIASAGLYYRSPEAAGAHATAVRMVYGADRLATWLIRPRTIRLDEIMQDPMYAKMGFSEADMTRLIEMRSAVLDVVHLLTTR
ncbi:MAG: HDOD domain-containing protein [Bacteroidota bacterium]